MALLASRTLFVVLSSPPAVLAFCGGCTVPCLLSLALGWVHFWPAVSTAPVRCEVCSLGCPSWLVHFLVSVCPSPALAVGWFGHRSVAPPAAPVCWAVVGSLLCRSVALACCRTLFFCCFSPGFLPLEFVQTWVGRLRSCLGSCLFWGELSFPCPGCFRLAVPIAWLSSQLALVGLRCLWVPRSCGVHGLRNGVTCLRLGLCSSSVCDRDDDFPSLWWVWFLAFVRVPCLRLELCSSACVSPGGCPSSQVGPAPSHGVPLLWTWLVWDASTVSFSYVFLWDVVTLWVNSVFLLLLIANEGLHWWLLLFRCSHPFWGRVVVFMRPPWDCRNFLWLLATLLPGLSLFFASGLSSPGRLCCLAMSLRCAALLYLWSCAHSLLAHGVRGLLACPSPSILLWFCKVRWVLFSPMVHTLRDGVTPAGSRLVCPRSERRFSVFYLSLWAVSSCCPCPSG